MSEEGKNKGIKVSDINSSAKSNEASGIKLKAALEELAKTKIDIPIGTSFGLAREISSNMVLPKSENPAKWMYDRLVEYIKDFESSLDSDKEIGAQLVSFGREFSFNIQDIGYYGPDIITFLGITQNGEKVQLVQNIAQLNVLFISVPKIHEEPRRIGFDLSEAISKENNS